VFRIIGEMLLRPNVAELLSEGEDKLCPRGDLKYEQLIMPHSFGQQTDSSVDVRIYIISFESLKSGSIIATLIAVPCPYRGCGCVLEKCWTRCCFGLKTYIHALLIGLRHVKSTTSSQATHPVD
jgi:hypothetical protein